MPARPPGHRETAAGQSTTGYIRVFNIDPEDAPSFAALEVAGWDDDRGAFLVRRCTITGRNDLLFNGLTPIPSGMEGQARNTVHITAGFIPEEGANPQPGDVWGVAGGSWLLSPRYTGYTVIDTTTAVRGFCVVTSQRTQIVDWVRISSGPSGAAPDNFCTASLLAFDPVANAWVEQSPPLQVWFRDATGRVLDPEEYASPLDVMAERVSFSNGFPVYIGRTGNRASDGSPAAAGCGWVSSVDSTLCLEMTVVKVSGGCSGGASLSDVVYLGWDSTNWKSGATDWRGASQVVFGITNGVPFAQIGGVYGTPLGCDGTGLLFSFGGLTLCPEGSGYTATCNDFFVVRFVCSCCPIAGWDGPGWYCVAEADADCSTAEPLELIDSDKCDYTIQICSGPYATEDDALAACPPVAPPGGPDCDTATTAALGDRLVGHGTGIGANNALWKIPILAGHTYRFRYTLTTISSVTCAAADLFTPGCVGGTHVQSFGPHCGAGTGCFSGTAVADGCLCVGFFFALPGDSGTLVVTEGSCP